MSQETPPEPAEQMPVKQTQPVKQAQALHCFVCGVENAFGLHLDFYEMVPTGGGPAQVVVDYTVPAHYQGYPGIVHGGIIATMLDEVMSRTIFRGESPRYVVTAKLSVRYRKPVPVETPLRLTGRVVEDKGRLISVAGTIHGPGGILLAEAEAQLVEVEASFFEGMTSQAELGWRVYPDQTDDSQKV